MIVSIKYFNNMMGRWMNYKCDSETLSDEDQKTLEKLVEDADFFNIQTVSKEEARGPRYEISIEGTTTHTFKSPAMDLPDRMLPLAQFIMDMRFMVAFINPYERDKAMGVSK